VDGVFHLHSFKDEKRVAFFHGRTAAYHNLEHHALHIAPDPSRNIAARRFLGCNVCDLHLVPADRDDPDREDLPVNLDLHLVGDTSGCCRLRDRRLLCRDGLNLALALQKRRGNCRVHDIGEDIFLFFDEPRFFGFRLHALVRGFEHIRRPALDRLLVADDQFPDLLTHGSRRFAVQTANIILDLFCNVCVPRPVHENV